MMMGTWFLGISIGEYLAGRAAEVSGSSGYGFLFAVVIIGSLIVAVALFAVAPAIKRMLSRDAQQPAELPRAVAEPKAKDPAEGGLP
jgi:dipeptide/tripeptide permease